MNFKGFISSMERQVYYPYLIVAYRNLFIMNFFGECSLRVVYNFKNYL